MFIELEWNPWSAASRAARAERAGRYGTALRWYARDRRGERHLIACLRYGLPRWPASDRVVAAAVSLLHLQRALSVARDLRVPSALVDGIDSTVDGAAALVWTTADRLSAAAAQSDSPRRLQPYLQLEIDRLDMLVQTVRDVRAELAALSLRQSPTAAPDGEFDRTLAKLAALGESAHDLQGVAE